MELTREQVNVGIAAGLALTNPEDERLYCPMKHLAGTLVLRQLLMSLASGQIGLTSAMQEGDKTPPATPPATPPNGSQGPALKKGAKKKVAKKTSKKK